MVTLQCDMSGVYKPSKTRKKLNLEGTSSRKCDCPGCVITLRRIQMIGGWPCLVEFTTMSWSQS